MGVICLWCLDPGQHSGVVWGRVWEQGLIADRLAQRSHWGTTTVTGGELEQARKLWALYRDFRYECQKAGLKVEMVIEDFILTRLKSSDRSGISPVRVTSMFMGYRHGLSDAYNMAGFGPTEVIEPVYQQPSDAMTYATDERLRRWGLWIPGAEAEHEREATKHFCLRVANRAKMAAGQQV